MKIPIRGRDKVETLENIFILVIFLGVTLFAVGTFVSVYAPKGVSAILSMLGGFLALTFSILLVIVWFLKNRGD